MSFPNYDWLWPNHSLSIKAAAPMPVPIHIETTPSFLFCLASSGNKVAICLEPYINKSQYLCSPMDDPRQWPHPLDSTCPLKYPTSQLSRWLETQKLH